MDLYLIRHAQSGNNVLADARQRTADPPLTEIGNRQAAALAKHLASGMQQRPDCSLDGPAGDCAPYAITRLYCSPMWRALATALPVGRALGIRPSVWVDVHELGGIFLEEGEPVRTVGYPGKTRREILGEFPGYALPPEITDEGWYPHPTMEEVAVWNRRASRVAATLQEWAADPSMDGERIAVITHGGFMDSLLKVLLHGSPSTAVFYQHWNTGITRLAYRRDSPTFLRYSNDVSHLPTHLLVRG